MSKKKKKKRGKKKSTLFKHEGERKESEQEIIKLGDEEEVFGEEEHGNHETFNGLGEETKGIE